MVEAAKAVMHSKYSLLQLDLKELTAQDANITFTRKSELSQCPCKYVWNCPEIVCKVFSLGDSKLSQDPKAYDKQELVPAAHGLWELPAPPFLIDYKLKIICLLSTFPCLSYCHALAKLDWNSTFHES